MGQIINRRRVMGGGGNSPYVNMPLTIESTSDNNVISWVAWFETTPKVIVYSTDDGLDFSQATSSSEGTVLATLNTGDKMQIAGFEQSYADTLGPNSFLSTGTYIVYGNIMSMIDGVTFKHNVGFVTGSSFVFAGLFMANEYLTSAKHLILPATELVENCYNSMFTSCLSLTTAPELPATELVEKCYNSMFDNCPSLNYIKCLATDISASDCTTNWVTNVPASGTFVKAAGMIDWTTGYDGIPSGWTVVNA